MGVTSQTRSREQPGQGPLSPSGATGPPLGLPADPRPRVKGWNPQDASPAPGGSSCTSAVSARNPSDGQSRWPACPGLGSGQPTGGLLSPETGFPPPSQELVLPPCEETLDPVPALRVGGLGAQTPPGVPVIRGDDVLRGGGVAGPSRCPTHTPSGPNAHGSLPPFSRSPGKRSRC